MTGTFKRRLKEVQDRVEACLKRVLPDESEGPGRLHEALHYSMFGRAKRVRPALCLWSCEAAGGDSERALEMAAALEMIHVYSLIHDDLPAMDDDDMRRGRPSCHIAFDEATAILAGDALLTESCGVIAEAYGEDALLTRDLVKILVKAAGASGMVGGQALDMAAMGSHEDLGKDEQLKALEAVHAWKTGALLLGSSLSGGRIAGASEDLMGRLETYGRCIGLAFQVTDDILDCTVSSAELGKTSGKDEAQGKLTYPGILGLAGAREKADTLLSMALEAIAPLGSKADALRDLGRFIVERSL